MSEDEFISLRIDDWTCEAVTGLPTCHICGQTFTTRPAAFVLHSGAPICNVCVDNYKEEPR